MPSVEWNEFGHRSAVRGGAKSKGRSRSRSRSRSQSRGRSPKKAAAKKRTKAKAGVPSLREALIGQAAMRLRKKQALKNALVDNGGLSALLTQAEMDEVGIIPSLHRGKKGSRTALSGAKARGLEHHLQDDLLGFDTWSGLGHGMAAFGPRPIIGPMSSIKSLMAARALNSVSHRLQCMCGRGCSPGIGCLASMLASSQKGCGSKCIAPVVKRRVMCGAPDRYVNKSGQEYFRVSGYGGFGQDVSIFEGGSRSRSLSGGARAKGKGRAKGTGRARSGSRSPKPTTARMQAARRRANAKARAKAKARAGSRARSKGKGRGRSRSKSPKKKMAGGCRRRRANSPRANRRR